MTNSKESESNNNNHHHVFQQERFQISMGIYDQILLFYTILAILYWISENFKIAFVGGVAVFIPLGLLSLYILLFYMLFRHKVISLEGLW